MSKLVQNVICMLFVCLNVTVWANNITVSIVSSVMMDTDILEVELAVEWEHSWNESSVELNHDAAWLYFKSSNNLTKE